MNMNNKDPWTESEIRLVHVYKSRILQESGGNGVSNKSPSLIELQKLCLDRTPMAVHNKVRTTLMADGSIVTRRQMSDRLSAKTEPDPNHGKGSNSFFDYKPRKESEEVLVPAPNSKPVMVSVPLSKLYGKVDFHTFMSLINE